MAFWANSQRESELLVMHPNMTCILSNDNIPIENSRHLYNKELPILECVGFHIQNTSDDSRQESALEMRRTIQFYV